MLYTIAVVLPVPRDTKPVLSRYQYRKMKKKKEGGGCQGGD